jgi:hypothetical protein
LARRDWPVPIQTDHQFRPSDLTKIGWPRSNLTPSVSDLLSPAGSRSHGWRKRGGWLTKERSSTGPAVLEIDGEVSPEVVELREDDDGVQEGTARMMVCRDRSVDARRCGRRLVYRW